MPKRGEALPSFLCFYKMWVYSYFFIQKAVTTVEPEMINPLIVNNNLKGYILSDGSFLAK